MQVKAKALGLKITPRKMGLIAGLIRLRKVADAQVILEHTPKKGARLLGEVLSSALANAENNHHLRAEDMTVKMVLVSPGPILKRFRAASRGMAHAVKYRSSNVTVILEDLDSAKPATKKVATKSKPKTKAKV